MSKIITLTPEQVKAHPLIRKKGNKDIPILFYDFLAEHEHIPDNTMIQCTHVNIAKIFKMHGTIMYRNRN